MLLLPETFLMLHPNPCLLAWLACVRDDTLNSASLPTSCWMQPFPWVLCTTSSQLQATVLVSPSFVFLTTEMLSLLDYFLE